MIDLLGAHLSKYAPGSNKGAGWETRPPILYISGTREAGYLDRAPAVPGPMSAASYRAPVSDVIPHNVAPSSYANLVNPSVIMQMYALHAIQPPGSQYVR